MSKMSNREKILAASVGLVLVVAAGLFALQNIGAAFTAQQRAIDEARKTVRTKELTIRAGQIARDKITHYEQRSLPADLGEARSQYQEWLLDTTYDFFGDNKMLVKPSGGERSRGAVYDRLKYSIAGVGDLDQLTRFLYRFYDMNYLHRIDSLRIQPIASSKLLKISCDVEALVVNSTTKTELGEQQGDRLPPDSLDGYLAHILERNVFGKPNEAPQISPVRSQLAYRGEDFSQTISAREYDELDILYFELEEPPSGMRLEQPEQSGDTWSARLSWRPSQNGTYDVTVLVADDGLPSKSDRVSFQIEVQDPPEPAPTAAEPRRPQFNFAKYTYLTSVQAINGKPIIWLYSRPTGEKIICGEGDEVEVGDYQALVRRIDVETNQIELEVEDEVQVLRLGQNLLEARPKSTGKIGQATSGQVPPVD